MGFRARAAHAMDHILPSCSAFAVLVLRSMAVISVAVMRPRDVLALQMDMWAVAYLNGRRFVSFPLAKTGDSDWKEILSEYALVARNEKASGGVFDNTTS